VNSNDPSPNQQSQIPWSEDAGPELDEAIERVWLVQERPRLGGIGSMMADTTVVPRVRRRRGAKAKFLPELIKEAQEDLLASGMPLRPYVPAVKHVSNFLKRKGLTLDKRQFKTIVRRIIAPLLPEEHKPKKRQPRKNLKTAPNQGSTP
jgi:hypothetical protein